ncbi:MAG: T9SS type A sorting domain-containing protein [Saprospiraceae bacterium]
MKTRFIFFILLFVSKLAGQPPTECAANAGKDLVICYQSPSGLTISTQPNSDYLQVQWSYQGSDGNVQIVNPNSYSTHVTYAGGNNWPPNTTYIFRLLVKCKDINGDGVHDMPFDDMMVTVKGDVVQPQIIEPDSLQDGQVRACTEVTLMVTPPGPGDTGRVSSIKPNDPKISYNLNLLNGTLFIKRATSNSPGPCNYTVVYTIDNGGCSRSDTVKVYFVRPHDPDSNGIIIGRVQGGCPSCGDSLVLEGDNPGCGGRGKWTLDTLQSDGTMVYLSEDLPKGDAKVRVSGPGDYTFIYTVDNVAPCPSSVDTVHCSVLSVEDVDLGPSKVLLFCDNVIPQDTFHFAYPYTQNTVYNWVVHQNAVPGITITDPHNHASDVIFAQPVSLDSFQIDIQVTAYRLYIDADCDGEGYEELALPPGNTPQQNWVYYQQIKNTPGLCFEECKAYSEINFMGSPVLDQFQEDVNFLCGVQGAQGVVLADYFSVLNVGYTSEASVVAQPVGSNLGFITSTTPMALMVGDYRFRIVLIASSPTGQFCSTVIYINIRVRDQEQIIAGTDQVKCYNEPTRLNGNDPYGGSVSGTWRQVNCSPCTIVLLDPNDPNTQVIMAGLDPNTLPVTLFFEWSFNNTDPSCNVTDTTQVTVNPCLVPCNELVSVNHVCLEDAIILTLLDSNDAVVDSSVYDIRWAVQGGIQTGNPITVPNTGVVNYTVQVVLNYQNEIVCDFNASGSAVCKVPPSGCGITILEECDSCGNVIVKAVDSLGNIVIPVFAVHEFRWKVYGEGLTDTTGVTHTENPITVNPNACYELTYDNFTYGPNITPVPGAGTLCRFKMPKQCVSISCPDPNCEDFNFYIAGCGDDKDVALGLTFPANCYSVTNGLWGTLGVFNAATNLPVDTNIVNVVWKNTEKSTYVTGNILTINTVTITQKDGCCVWEDKYTPICMCSCEPYSILCEQPIVRYCHENGTSTYVPGIPRIAWTGVPGALGYILEIDFGAIGEEGCCAMPSGTGIVYDTVSTSPWEIPINWRCFTIRIKAINQYAICPETDWSDPYLYCQGVCSPVIITCGCCHGRSSEGYSLPSIVQDEAEILEQLNRLPGYNFSTLEEALDFVGWGNLTQTGFKVFPNPANQSLSVRRSGPAKHYFIQITDLLNREYLVTDITDKTESVFDIGDLPQGVYLLHIRSANGDLINVEKVLIMR